MIRRGWLERGPGPDRRRGADDFVPVSWDEALDRLAAELRRIYTKHGPHACSAAPTAGPAPAGFTTRSTSSTAF